MFGPEVISAHYSISSTVCATMGVELRWSSSYPPQLHAVNGHEQSSRPLHDLLCDYMICGLFTCSLAVLCRTCALFVASAILFRRRVVSLYIVFRWIMRRKPMLDGFISTSSAIFHRFTSIGVCFYVIVSRHLVYPLPIMGTRRRHRSTD